MSNVQIIIITAILRRRDGGKLVTVLFLATAGLQEMDGAKLIPGLQDLIYG